MKRESGKPASAVILVPMGRLPAELLRGLQERLRETLHRPVSVGKPVGLPPTAYYPQRQQYLGEAILAALRPLPLPPGTQAVALVDGDCYAPGLNFVFGQAARGGMMAFVALPRLRQSFHGQPEDPALFQERVLKEVIHELGHTWNLSHCSDVRCVMHFSDTLQDTDLKTVDFCAHCQKRLGRPTTS